MSVEQMEMLGSSPSATFLFLAFAYSVPTCWVLNPSRGWFAVKTRLSLVSRALESLDSVYRL